MFESYTTALLRTPRFVISGSIIIATAIGAASVATAGLTAHYVAKSETDRIVAEQKYYVRLGPIGLIRYCNRGVGFPLFERYSNI